MFELFAETIDGIPSKALLRFLKRESETVKDALRHKRVQETHEINSILCFCEFMNSIAEEKVILPTTGLPIGHIVFYRKIVLRLIDAGEIPESAKERFDAVFSSGFLKSMANN